MVFSPLNAGYNPLNADYNLINTVTSALPLNILCCNSSPAAKHLYRQFKIMVCTRAFERGGRAIDEIMD